MSWRNSSSSSSRSLASTSFTYHQNRIVSWWYYIAIGNGKNWIFQSTHQRFRAQLKAGKSVVIWATGSALSTRALFMVHRTRPWWPDRLRRYSHPHRFLFCFFLALSLVGHLFLFDFFLLLLHVGDQQSPSLLWAPSLSTNRLVYFCKKEVMMTRRASRHGENLNGKRRRREKRIVTLWLRAAGRARRETGQ